MGGIFSSHFSLKIGRKGGTSYPANFPIKNGINTVSEETNKHTNKNSIIITLLAPPFS